jgi:hypothetical protein
MAKHKNGELNGSAVANNGEREAIKPATVPAQLPTIESPSISPAVSEPVAIDEVAVAPKHEPEVEAVESETMSESNPPSDIEPNFALVPVAQPAAQAAEVTVEMPKVAPFFTLKARHRRYARIAASVAIGAVLGAIGGTLLTGGLSTRPAQNVAMVEENKAMQQSLTRLAKDVSVLKTKLASSDKIASNLVAKGRAKSPERILQESADITGSISAPATVVASIPASIATPALAAVSAPSSTAALPPAPVAAAVPVPRPAPRMAMAESQLPARLSVVRDWSIRDAQGGYIYVENHGEIYQIVPGAPLPGLGPVQSIKRLEGRWVVTTPKGIIVSMRDRRYFE